MIRSMHVKNFKCLRDVQVALEPLTVLIGENDTGKSSFLESIRVLAETAGAKNRLLNTAEDFQRRISRPSESGNIEWTARYEFGRGASSQRVDYRLALAPASPGSNGASTFSLVDETMEFGASSLQFLRDGAVGVFQLHSADGAFKSAATRGSQTTLLRTLEYQSAAPVQTRAFSHAARSVELFRFDPSKLAQAVPAPRPNESTTDLLKEDGSGLPAALDLMVGAHNESFQAIQRELSAFSPQIRAVKIVPGRIENGPENGKRVAIELQSRQVVDFREVSDGIRLALAFFTLLHAPDSPEVVMIEEPENGIHPRALGSVVEALKQMSRPRSDGRQVQVILTTHSPYLLDCVPADCVRVFGRKKSGDSYVCNMLDLPDVRARLDSGLSLGEMWFNVGEKKLLERQAQ